MRLASKKAVSKLARNNLQRRSFEYARLLSAMAEQKHNHSGFAFLADRIKPRPLGYIPMGGAFFSRICFIKKKMTL